MAGTEWSEKQIFKMKLLVDKEKNKVVWAEAGKDFVDVLFSFLAMPMGTIVRLLEKYHQDQKSQVTSIGCFNSLYKSVVDMRNDDFLTKACKDILVYPRYLKEMQCKRLKLNIDDTEVLKYYMCPNLEKSESCAKAYSNFCSLRCSCGNLMTDNFIVREYDCNEIFVSKKTSFIVTDNMKVEFASISLIMKTLMELGYNNFDNLEEMFVDVNQKEVLALLECFFSSDTPLTDVFLTKRNSCVITKTHNMPSLAVQDKAEPKELLSLTAFVRKQDSKILCVESEQDFVDLLLIFLALPLESVWEISRTNVKMGCTDNFYKSMKSFIGGTNASHYTCMLPWQYDLHTPLLDVCCEKESTDWTLTINSLRYDLKPMYPNYDGSAESTIHSSRGLVKGGTAYMISDDLAITPINSSSTFCKMKKWNVVDLNDIEEHVINISKTEAISLLRASLMTSTALTTALGSLLPTKPKEEHFDFQIIM